MALPIMRYRTPVDGSPMSDAALWPPAQYEFPPLERIQAIKRPNVVSNVQAGKYDPSPAGASPIYETDCVTGNRWAANGPLVSREVDSAILRGIPRDRFRRTAGADGISGQLAGSLTSMTVLMLFKLIDLAANGALYGLGITGTTRSFAYVDTNGKIVHQNGTSDSHTSAGALAINQWHAGVFSFDGATKQFRALVNDPANPFMAVTKTNGLPTDLAMSFGIAPNLTQPANMEFIHYGTLDTALHLDAAGLAEVMAGLNTIRTL